MISSSPAEDPDLREIGDEAIWTLSTAKPGSGIDKLRDGSAETFWQSDGPQPHFVNVQFTKKMRVSEVRLYVSYRQDESYTPSTVAVQIGNGFHDLQEIRVVELKEPQGWVTLKLGCDENDANGFQSDFVRTFLIRIVIKSNHQNGRDTHVRLAKIYGPRSKNQSTLAGAIPFRTVALTQYACIR